MASVRAIYRNGQVQILDPYELKEGQALRVQIIENEPPLQDLLADILVRYEDIETLPLDDTAIFQLLDEALKGLRPLSEIIIEER